ncbi:DNA adenine methylase [Vibrio sp. 10N.261.55.F6]|uniref:DNA adenine methylase n=1 Tax=Vibrio sp. 10N.261.55.F6 TaxID=3229693 RepID=UPI00354C023A
MIDKRILEQDAMKTLKKKSIRAQFGVGHIPRNCSPFRYPGGKDKLASFLAIFLSVNKIHNGRFIEPFCGGAGASLSLLLGGYVREIHLNDKNYALYCFWKAIKDDTENLLDRVFCTRPNIDEWHKQKSIYLASIGKKHDSFSTLDFAYSVFFLNRSNRSGVLSAGPIGGLNQTGNYKIDCRYTTEALIKKIEAIAAYKDSFHVYNEDCIEFLERFNNEDCYDDDFIYLDPPYVKEGRNIYSKNFCFDNNMHKTLKDYIIGHSKRWLISYDDHPLVHELYSSQGARTVEFSYVMNRARVGRELMIADSRLRMPETLFSQDTNGETTGSTEDTPVIKTA